MTSTRIDLQAIAEALAALAPDFTVTYEGDRAPYIRAEAPGAVWIFGTNLGPLGVDYYNEPEAFDAGEAPARSFDIPLAESDTTPEDIASAIFEACAREVAQEAHAAGDPHCTCNDCIADLAAADPLDARVIDACAEYGHNFDSAQNLDGGRCRKCGVRR
jgi:hypothetical protein